jgi:hypothetical protein
LEFKVGQRVVDREKVTLLGIVDEVTDHCVTVNFSTAKQHTHTRSYSIADVEKWLRPVDEVEL